MLGPGTGSAACAYARPLPTVVIPSGRQTMSAPFAAASSTRRTKRSRLSWGDVVPRGRWFTAARVTRRGGGSVASAKAASRHRTSPDAVQRRCSSRRAFAAVSGAR